MKATALTGVFTALVTPFRQGKIDEDAFRKLIDFQLKNGVQGLVVCGTTGEAPTLTTEEEMTLIRIAVAAVGARVPIVVGSGSNSTAKALELTRKSAECGAQASLSVCPYYNKPTQEGIYQHFECLADESPMPLILYNIPGRTGVNMQVDTILKLAAHENIIGIKEASGGVEHTAEILRHAPKDFVVLSGDDVLTLPLMALGATGVVSTTSNVAPRWMSDLCEAALKGDFKGARALHFKLAPLFLALFCETNPVPAKTALSLMGMMTNEVRLPLSMLTQPHVELVRKTLSFLQLL